jgi:hypothetical protein
MVNLSVGNLTALDVKDLYQLWILRVDDSQDVWTERNVSLVEEFDSEALVLWSRDKLAFVRVDEEVLTSIDEGEVLSSLYNKRDHVF